MPKKKEDNVKEEFTVLGKELKKTIIKLIKEGNVRRIRIKHKGKVYLEIPVTVTAVAVILAPVLAVIGIIATLFSECTVEIERKK